MSRSYNPRGGKLNLKLYNLLQKQIHTAIKFNKLKNKQNKFQNKEHSRILIINVSLPFSKEPNMTYHIPHPFNG